MADLSKDFIVNINTNLLPAHAVASLFFPLCALQLLKTKPSTLAQTPHVKHGGGGVMIQAHFAPGGCGHLGVKHELLCRPKYSREKCEAMCPNTYSWATLGHPTGQ